MEWTGQSLVLYLSQGKSLDPKYWHAHLLNRIHFPPRVSVGDATQVCGGMRSLKLTEA